MKIITYTLFVALTCCANPVSVFLVSPPFVMVAENVYIGLKNESAVVSGRFLFKQTPDVKLYYKDPPYPINIILPIVVPQATPIKKSLLDEIKPALYIAGAKYYPRDEIRTLKVDNLPEDYKAIAFYFFVEREDLAKEVDLSIQYIQPMRKVDEGFILPYLPFIPHLITYQKTMDIREDSFVIHAECSTSSFLSIETAKCKILKNSNTLISLRPKHQELIEIKYLPNKSARANPPQRGEYSRL